MLGANGQPVQLLTIGGQVVEVDLEIASIVKALNDGGIETVAGYKWGRMRGIIKWFREARVDEIYFVVVYCGGGVALIIYVFAILMIMQSP